VLGPVLLAAWLLDGPLAAGWARRAGTPVALLGTSAARVVAATPPSAAAPAPASLTLPFTAQVAGRLTQTSTATGVTVDIALSDSAGRAVAIRIVGQPSPGGGVAMTGSLVRLGTAARPAVYRGQIVGLSGGNLTAALSDGTHRVRLDAVLRIEGTAVDGSTTVSPAA
jgi:hypothetical protein